MDTVIFSGRVSKNEMLHERHRWYDRLVAEGRLEEHRVRDEWLRWKNIARSFGYFFFGLGVILLLLIIYAMITRLTHWSRDDAECGSGWGSEAQRKKCEDAKHAKQCRVISPARRNPEPVWVFSDMRLSC